MATLVSIIIPAHQEEHYIGACLAAVLAQDALGRDEFAFEAVVVANGCRDATAERARAWIAPAAARGLALRVLELETGGKAGALNAGDAATGGDLRVYLDADVLCSPGLLGRLVDALAGDAPRYASGALRAVSGASWASGCYARAWSRLPFVARDVSGCGLYAVNAAGRARWGAFPNIHSDDKFVRLQFAPAERVKVDAPYEWPVPQGFRNLVNVRRRWCEGNAELLRTYPELRGNQDAVGRMRDYGRLLAGAPVSTMVFASVFGLGLALAQGAPPTAEVRWRRGR